MALVDLLRFVAAFAVVLFHFTSRSHPAWGDAPSATFPNLSQITAAGAFGVDLFFVVSGFVILMTAWGRDMRSFVTSRVTRLFPAYWAAVLLTGALLLVVWPEPKDLDVVDVGVNLTMLQEAFGYPHVDGVYWTLWVELRFYVLVAGLLLAGITATRVLVFAAIWPVLAAMAYETGSELLAEILIWNYAPLFAGGMALFVLSRDRRSLFAGAVLAQNVILSVVWSGSQTQGLVARNTGHLIPMAVCAAIVVGCFTLVGIATMSRLRHVSAAWLTMLGALTYPLYLIHEYWGWWFIDRLHEHLPTYAVLSLVTALVTAMAWALHRLVERPLAPRLRSGLVLAFATLTPRYEQSGPGRGGVLSGPKLLPADRSNSGDIVPVRHLIDHLR